MEHEPSEEDLNFLEFRDKVRKNFLVSSNDKVPNSGDERPLLPSEVPLSNQSPPLTREIPTPKSNWTDRVKVMLGILREKSIAACICEVPNELRKVNEDAYSPRIVSIGPLHYGEHDLLAMEEHKWQYMLKLLYRTSEPEKFLSKSGNAILKLEETARGSYMKRFKFNTNELVEIMLVDGCFILELFLRSSDRNFNKASDLIFRNTRTIPSLKHDLALLENQIPFIVLDLLFDIFMHHFPKCCRQYKTIDQLALSFFLSKNYVEEASTNGRSQKVRHLLDLLHKFYLPSSSQIGPKSKTTPGVRKCATQLLEAGIEIEKGKDRHLLDISFKNGVLTIPPLHLDEIMDSLLRNLIVFEQSTLGTTLHITSYTFLVKSLIHSLEDYELIERKGIITKDLDGAKSVLTTFDTNSVQDLLGEFYFGELCGFVDAYQQSWWNWRRIDVILKNWWRKCMALLKRDYCSNVWRSLSVFAAVVLLILTSLQTIYTVWTFYAK